jgi:sodium/potassium-transporting ATPase subunit alpha
MATLLLTVWERRSIVFSKLLFDLGNIVISIGMVVAYIPEGLPAAVTLVLTIVAKRMYKQKVLVKSLATVETFNCVSVCRLEKLSSVCDAFFVRTKDDCDRQNWHIDHGSDGREEFAVGNEGRV